MNLETFQRRRSFLRLYFMIWLTAVAGLIFLSQSEWVKSPVSDLLVVGLAACFGLFVAGYSFLLKCPHCKVSLAKSFPGEEAEGGIPLFGRFERCPYCQGEIDGENK